MTGTTTSTLPSVTTTTIPSGCPPYTATCLATGEREAKGAGGRFCAGGYEYVAGGVSGVSVEVDAVDLSSASLSAFVFGQRPGKVVAADAIVHGQANLAPDGALTVEEYYDPGNLAPVTAGCCPGDPLAELRGIRARITIERVCQVGEAIPGSLEVDVQCLDGSYCSSGIIYFTAFRNQ